MHCDYSSVRTAKKILGEKLFLVSDSMSFVGAKTNKLIIEGTEITFKDGVHTKLAIQNILKEFSNINDVKHIEKIKWDSSLKNLNY